MSVHHLEYPFETFTIDSLEDLRRHIEGVYNEPGKLRGTALRSDIVYAILQKKGNAEVNYVKEIEDTFEKLGYDFKFKSFKPYSWYPDGYIISVYFVVMYLYKWTFHDIHELGYLSRGSSMLINILTRFATPEKMFTRASATWERYYDYGSLVEEEYKPEERFYRFTLRDYAPHPVVEAYQTGFFEGVVELSTGTDDVIVSILESVYAGAEHSMYKITW